jgi:hypothetical protein
VSGERVQYGRGSRIPQPPGGQFRNRPLRLPEHRSGRRSPLMQEEHWSECTPDPCRIPQQVRSGTPSDWRNRSQCRCSW